MSRLTYTLTKLGYLRYNMRLEYSARLGGLVDRLSARLDERAPGGPSGDEELADYCSGSVSMGADRLNMVYVETCRSGNGITSTTLPDIGTRCRSRSR